MIYDIITVSLFLLFTILGAFRGAAKTVLGIICTFVSYLAAILLSRIISVWIYASFIKNTIIDTVSSSVAEASENTLSSVIDALPSFLKSLVSLSPASYDSNLSDLSGKAAVSVESAVSPVIISAISFFLTIILFVLLSFLLRHIAVKPLVKFFDRSALSGVNRFLGAVLGALEAVLFICVIAYLLRIILPHIYIDSIFLSESTIYNSYIFYHFYSGNIFTAIISLFR